MKVATKPTRIADLDELWTELLSRNGVLVWKTREGKIIPIRELTDSHLKNIIKMLQEHEKNSSAWCNPYEEAAANNFDMSDL